MNLVKFVDNRFQECRLKQSEDEAQKVYNVANDAEAQAAVAVLGAYRTLLKWVMVPKVVIHFILVSLGIVSAPKPAIMEKMEADRLKELQAKSAKLAVVADATDAPATKAD